MSVFGQRSPLPKSHSKTAFQCATHLFSNLDRPLPLTIMAISESHCAQLDLSPREHLIEYTYPNPNNVPIPLGSQASAFIDIHIHIQNHVSHNHFARERVEQYTLILAGTHSSKHSPPDRPSTVEVVPPSNLPSTRPSFLLYRST